MEDLRPGSGRIGRFEAGAKERWEIWGLGQGKVGDLGLRPGRDELSCLDLRGVKGLGTGTRERQTI